MNTKTREITEGAMVVAIMGVFLLVDKYLANTLQAYLFFLMPLPTLIYSAKYGLKKSIVTVICVILAGFIVASDSFLTIIIYAILGQVYGSGVYAKKSNNWLLISAFAVCLVEYVISMIIIPIMYGMDIYAEMEAITEMMQSASTLGDPDMIAGVLKKLFPAALILSALLEALLVHILSHLILKRLRIEVPELTKLGYITMPTWLGWTLFALFAAGQIVGGTNILPGYQETGYAISTVCQLIFSFFGYIDLVIVSKLTKNKILLVIAMACIFFANFLLFILGVIDSVSPDFKAQLIERFSNYGDQQNQ